MKEDERQALEEAQKIYADVSNWLNFCELKHAGMFAAYIALFIAVLQLETSICIGARIAVLSAILVCVVINGLSFIPFLNQSKWIVRKCRNVIRINGNENKVFYQSIFARSVRIKNDKAVDSRNDYKQLFMKEFPGKILQPGSLLDNYLDQIVDISMVVSIKAYLFSIACKFSVLVIFFCIVMLVCIA